MAELRNKRKRTAVVQMPDGPVARFAPGMTPEEKRKVRNAQARASKLRNREAYEASLAATAKWIRENPDRVLYRSLGKGGRSKSERGILNELSFEQFQEIVAPMVCCMTGLPLAYGAGDFAPSLDRIKNDKGYEPDNVRLVCWMYNRARGQGDDDAVLRMARALVAKYGMEDG